jgi:tetratricopeptide (TPR) repeat protein
LLFESGDSEQAIQLLNKAIRIDSKSAYAYNERGLAYYYTNRFNQATEDYDRAIHLDPEYADPYNNRGIVHSELGRFEQAMHDYDKVIQLNPEYAFAYSNRAILYKELGRSERAQKDIEVVKTLDPELGDTHDTDSGPNYWIIGAGFLIGATLCYLGFKGTFISYSDPGQTSFIDQFGPQAGMILGFGIIFVSGYLLLAAHGLIDIFGDDD